MFEKINEKTKIVALVIFFSLLIVCVLIVFVPSFFRADLSKTEPIYREGDLHFNSLTRSEQMMYDAIVDAIEKYDEYTEAVPYVYSSEDFGKVVDCIIGDNPQYFYVDFDAAQSFISDTDTKIRLSYFVTRENADIMQSALKTKVKEIISGIPKGADIIGKELYIHDYLTQNCKYVSDVGYENLQNTAYGPIVNGLGYCDGYALAFKMLLNDLGIYCSTVSGKANNLSHMWNIVYIDDAFYYVDVTWDDADDSSEMLYHGYFNITEDRLKSTHTILAPSNVPMADTQRDYYDLIGHSAKSREELSQLLYSVLNESAENGRSWFEIGIRYDGGRDDLREVFTETVEKINSEGKYVFADAFKDTDCTNDGKYKNIEVFYEVKG